jgi:hypothetical protein
MAMSKRSGGEKQEDIWIAHTELLSGGRENSSQQPPGETKTLAELMQTT